MQRMRVDLPDPDGPITTTTSPRLTDKWMSLSTWNSPNHLFKPSISMMRSPPSGASARTTVLSVVVSLMRVLSRPGSARAPCRSVPPVRARERVARDTIAGRRNRVGGPSSRSHAELPFQLARRDAHAVREEPVDEREEQRQLQADATRHDQRCRLVGDDVGDVEEVEQPDD